MNDQSAMRSSEVVARWRGHLEDCRTFARAPVALEAHGRLVRVTGLVIETIGLALPLGSTCTISQNGTVLTEAEVVGFSGNRLFLMPTTEVHGLTPGALVTPSEGPYVGPRFGKTQHPWQIEDHTRHMPVGVSLLGRVVDGNGRPLDRLGALDIQETRPLRTRPINPIDRDPIRAPLDVGVRAINALLTTGRGQRMGLFAGSGVGKSVLLGMMARYTTADVTVVGLIGERGREVKEFIEDILGPDGLARAIVVAAPSDAPPLLRLQGAAYATSLAEHFRDEGKQVLLLMDSLTRYAMAQREIALAIGEPPATKGYPPSVFAKLPLLVERAGNGAENRAGGGTAGGSITAFYTVLTEGDDQQDPIADAARAILDGHIVLDRTLAEQGHFPAIDIETSISRVMHSLLPADDLALARRFKQLYSRYQRSHDLITVGAYVAGTDPLLDEAIALKTRLDAFLQQDLHERSTLIESQAALQALLRSSLARSSQRTEPS